MIAGGALLLAVTLWDAFETMVLSRRVSRRTRLTTLFYRLSVARRGARSARRAAARETGARTS